MVFVSAALLTPVVAQTAKPATTDIRPSAVVCVFCQRTRQRIIAMKLTSSLVAIACVLFQAVYSMPVGEVDKRALAGDNGTLNDRYTHMRRLIPFHDGWAHSPREEVY